MKIKHSLKLRPNLKPSRCSNCAQLESEALLAVRMLTDQHRREKDDMLAVILALLYDNEQLLQSLERQ